MTDFLRRTVERAGRFLYNARQARYEYASDLKPLSGSKLLDVLERREKDGFATMQRLGAALKEGKIGVNDWQNAVAFELRRAHSQAYALGRGGWQQMTSEDRAAVSARLRSEFDYLRQFAGEIASGKLSDKQIAARVEMYAKHIQTSYYTGETAAKIDAGLTQEMRVLGATHRHCMDCPGYAGHWEPIGTLPEPGLECQCTAYCKCSKIYR